MSVLPHPATASPTQQPKGAITHATAVQQYRNHMLANEQPGNNPTYLTAAAHNTCAGNRDADAFFPLCICCGSCCGSIHDRTAVCTRAYMHPGPLTGASRLLLDSHGLNGGDTNGVDNVGHSAPPAEVVDWLEQPLHDRPHGDRACGLLHRLVRVVACVEVREHEDCGFARHLTRAFDLDSCNSGVNSCVVLDGALDLDVRPGLLDDGHCLGHPLDLRPCSRAQGGVGEHGNTRLHTKGCCCVCADHGDLRQLLAGGVHVDGAVTVHQHTVRQAHEEDGGDQGGDAWQLQDLHCWPDGGCGGVDGSRHHAVSVPAVHHHHAERVDVPADHVRSSTQGRGLLAASLHKGGRVLLQPV
mmetsp:Transcript_19762/g.42935  ORF Transcript_19762/g.42935 Transcript_19762/m.42935 type:complete len:356 (+) Transcript_19762:666-1733(+)